MSEREAQAPQAQESTAPQAGKPKAPRAPRQPKLLVQRRNGTVILIAKNGVTAEKLAKVSGLAPGLAMPSVTVPRDKVLAMVAAILGD